MIGSVSGVIPFPLTAPLHEPCRFPLETSGVNSMEIREIGLLVRDIDTGGFVGLLGVDELWSCRRAQGHIREGSFSHVIRDQHLDTS